MKGLQIGGQALVATWNPAAASGYYTRQRETDYYTQSQEPEGIWYARDGDFGLVDGAIVDRRTFERLYAAVDKDGRPLLDKVRRHSERTPAFDVTLSAPRSVSLAWAFAPRDTRGLIELAQQRAVRATLAMLEREAIWARRGRNGAYMEKVALSAATFQQGESRAAAHADGTIFGDPNLHTHCVVLNLATRGDGTVGALHSKVLRDFKMAAGATYHAALAHELQTLGFQIDRVGKNGIFELAGVDEDLIRYFSARRSEIEDQLAEHGVTSAQAVALAAAITKASRSSKRPHDRPREEMWAAAAQSFGLEITTFTHGLRRDSPALDQTAAEQLLAERLAVLPAALTERESVIDRRELVRAVTMSLVGTALASERAEVEVQRLLQQGSFVKIGRDQLGLPVYSTPEMIKIEREVVQYAQHLARRSWLLAARSNVDARCRAVGLSNEQIEAVYAATEGSAIAIIEGAPGSGKTTTLGPIVESYQNQGCRVIGTAAAWRVATMLRDDLNIESRATASWIARIKSGQSVLDDRTVLIADEAGLLSSRDMHVLLGAVARSNAKLILVGDRRQLQPIGGPGLDLVSRALEAARVETIVRQRERWAREAVAAFGLGRAAEALDAFAQRGLLIEAHGAKATIEKVLDEAERKVARDQSSSPLILAKSNVAIAAISRSMRERLKAAGRIRGKEVSFKAATPSGHDVELRLARGDRIRFLVRNDDLGVINGTVGDVLKVRQPHSLTGRTRRIRVEASVRGRKISFDPMQLADTQGRPRIAWAYAATIHASQGLTVDRAIVYVDPSYNRHDIFVAASRARDETVLVVDAKAIDKRLTTELPIDRQRDDLAFTEQRRRAWLAERISRASPKMSTWDVIGTDRTTRVERHARRMVAGLSYEPKR